MFRKIQSAFRKRSESAPENCPNVRFHQGAYDIDDPPQYCYPPPQTLPPRGAHPKAFNYLPIDMDSSSRVQVEYPSGKRGSEKESSTTDPVLAPGCPPGALCTDDEARRPHLFGPPKESSVDPVVAPGCPPGGICTEDGARRPSIYTPPKKPSATDPALPPHKGVRRPQTRSPDVIRSPAAHPPAARPRVVGSPAVRSPADRSPTARSPVVMGHRRAPRTLPADMRYDQLPPDYAYNQSPCDPYSPVPSEWGQQTIREKKPLYQDRRLGAIDAGACDDKPAQCKSEPQGKKYVEFLRPDPSRQPVRPESSRSESSRSESSRSKPQRPDGKRKVDAPIPRDPVSNPANRNLLDEVAEFYHQFPDLHTEVRIMVANNVTIYLLGTNHADPQCPIDVSNIVRTVRPQAVLIELCAWRACGCKEHVGNIFQTKPEFSFRYLRKVISQIGFLPAMIFFTDAFNEHTASERGNLLDYGAEFAVAAQACQELTDCKIVLADREIPITVKRQASAMGNWRGLKMTLLVTLSLLFKGSMKNFLLRGHRLVIRDPHFYQIVVLERDMFLTYMIQVAASLPYKQPRPKIVAVVGQGHLNGIQSFWGRVVPQVLPLILKSDIDM